MRPGARGARTLAALVAAVTPWGCLEALLAPEPADGPVAVAQAAWTEIDAYHAFFEQTGMDWDSVGTVYLPRVSATTTDADLFAILSEMITELRDGHARLRTPSASFAWDGWLTERPVNFYETILGSYLRPPSGTGAGGVVRWGTLSGGLGYVRIAGFGVPGIGEAVDLALGSLGDVPGLVVDIRGNGGGSDTHVKAAAGRLLSRRAHFRSVRYKAGPGHGDFGPEIRDYMEPTVDDPYDGPIVVLQNRGVFSAAETFVLAMRTRSNVTFVGDSTGGGSGNPIPRELPNRWVLWVSRWQATTPDGSRYEGIGLAPDVLESISEQDLADERDPILERAIELLSN